MKNMFVSSVRNMVNTEGDGFFRVNNTACSEYYPIFQVLVLVHCTAKYPSLMREPR